MKALSFASIVALALAGAACSQPAPAPETVADEPPIEVEITEAEAPVEDSGFNLDLFNEDSGDNGFNIGFEDDTGSTPSGFDFIDEERPTSFLDDIPEISAPTLPEGETTVAIPELPADEDEIIRLPD